MRHIIALLYMIFIALHNILYTQIIQYGNIELGKYLVPTDITLVDGFEFGYPSSESVKWFGLWSPVLNCFVLVHYDLDLLEKVRMLGTSKLMIKIVELPVESYLENQLDNQCCEKWTIESIEKINFGSLYKSENQEIPKVSIVPTNLCDDRSEIKSWFIFLLKWARILESWRNKYKDFLQEIIGYQEPSKSIIPDIYRLLWLGDDIATVEGKIKNLLESTNTTESRDLLKNIKCLS